MQRRFLLLSPIWTLPAPNLCWKHYASASDVRMFGYSLHSASPEYHEAIQGWFKRRHNWDIDAKSIVYSPGTVDALDAIVRAYTEPGDGVIIQRPVDRPHTGGYRQQTHTCQQRLD